MHEQVQRLFGVRQVELSSRTQKEVLLAVDPLDPRHPLRPSVLDARLARSNMQIPRLRPG
jgi:hypothetical protein